MIKVGTFCTGIGSPEFALEETEHELAFACEIDKFARASFLSRFKPKLMFQDMTKIDWKNPALATNIVIAGLPCQAFSIAGKRLGEQDKRGILIYDFYKYLKVHQPEIFILENVKGLKSINKGEIFLNWQRILGRSVNGKVIEDPHSETLGYNLHWKVLNTKNFDLPQNRERIFIVGIRSDLPNVFSFPENRILELRLRDMLEENVHEKYYLSEHLIKGLVNNDICKTIRTSGRQSTEKHSWDLVRVEGFINQNTQASKVYSKENIAPTICSGTHGYANGYIEDKLIPFGNSQDQKLSSIDGISQTLSVGHFNQPKIMVSKEVRSEEAKAIRKENLKNGFDYNPHRAKDIIFEDKDFVNTITTGQTKDNLLLIKTNTKKGFEEVSEGDSINFSQLNSETRRGRVGHQIANTLDTVCNQAIVLEVVANTDSVNEMRGRVYGDNGLSPTITAKQGGGHEPLIAVKQLNPSKESGGRQPYKQNRVFDADQLSPTLDTECGRPSYIVKNRIRRLTPLECWRLQGFSDEYFYQARHESKVEGKKNRGMSDTQLYKQAGNSISNTVVKAVLKEVWPLLDSLDIL